MLRFHNKISSALKFCFIVKIISKEEHTFLFVGSAPLLTLLIPKPLFSPLVFLLVVWHTEIANFSRTFSDDGIIGPAC
jgi:hypothetical protein